MCRWPTSEVLQSLVMQRCLLSALQTSAVKHSNHRRTFLLLTSLCRTLDVIKCSLNAVCKHIDVKNVQKRIKHVKKRKKGQE